MSQGDAGGSSTERPEKSVPRKSASTPKKSPARKKPAQKSASKKGSRPTPQANHTPDLTLGGMDAPLTLIPLAEESTGGGASDAVVPPRPPLPDESAKTPKPETSTDADAPQDEPTPAVSSVDEGADPADEAVSSTADGEALSASHLDDASASDMAPAPDAEATPEADTESDAAPEADAAAADESAATIDEIDQIFADATDDAVSMEQSGESAPDAAPADAGTMSLSHSPWIAAVPRDPEDEVDPSTAALHAVGLIKHFGGHRAVDGIDLTVPAGSFYGIVGPNGAGKTTTLSMIAGLLKPDGGSITVGGVDARKNPRAAKKLIGVLPDRLRTFDRLTGRQLLTYFGSLRGLSARTTEERVNDLARAFDLTEALGRVVSDYSAGMTKKVMLAGALIHSPRLLILDEPFESVDPVSSAVILDILTSYVRGGGTVILSSHGMDLVERVCERLAVIVAGHVLAEGTIEHVRAGATLEQRFVELSGGVTDVEGLEWLHTYSV